MTAPPAPAARPPRAGLVHVDDVQFHPRNVRRDLGDLRELTNSVARYGLLQPIVVEVYGTDDDGRPRFRLRAGHRRLAASRLAGLARLPALVHDHALPEAEWVLQALHENTMRRSLDPAERTDAIKRLRHLGKTTVEIADSLGVSVGTVRNWAAGVDAAPASVEPAASDEPAARREPDHRVTGSQPVRPGRKSVTVAVLARFAAAWRAEHERRGVNVDELLAALDQVAATGRITEALPQPPEGA